MSRNAQAGEQVPLNTRPTAAQNRGPRSPPSSPTHAAPPSNSAMPTTTSRDARRGQSSAGPSSNTLSSLWSMLFGGHSVVPETIRLKLPTNFDESEAVQIKLENNTMQWVTFKVESSLSSGGTKYGIMEPLGASDTIQLQIKEIYADMFVIQVALASESDTNAQELWTGSASKFWWKPTVIVESHVYFYKQ